MSILVEYRCQEFTGRQEQWVDGAVPPTTVCRASARRTGDPCRDFPDVPRVCCMALSVARRWAAQVCGDNRALEREYRRKVGCARPGQCVSGDQGSIASAASTTAAGLGTA
jgi:hypothetical protein